MRNLVRDAAVVLTAVALMVSSALLALPAGEAFAHARSTSFSSEQAGYAVTRAKFTEVEVWARLPDASKFSREVGRVGADRAASPYSGSTTSTSRY